MARQSNRDSTDRGWVGAGIAATAAVAGAAAFLLSRRERKPQGELVSDAPPHVLRGASQQGDAFIGKTVTIGRPRQELYARWRDFQSFPQFMENVEAVEDLGDGRSQWSIKGPAGSTVTLVTRMTDDQPGRLIAWKSEPQSDIETAGRVEFEDIDPVRGTAVRLLLRYDSPAGPVGRLAAKALQREPELQARRDLRRFKQLMETGEVTTNASPSARKSEHPAQDRI